VVAFAVDVTDQGRPFEALLAALDVVLDAPPAEHASRASLTDIGVQSDRSPRSE